MSYNELAFPFQENEEFASGAAGLTKLEFFKAAALVGILANDSWMRYHPEEAAVAAEQIAKAALSEAE